VQGHLLHPNLGLLVTRQTKEPFAVLATRQISTHKIVAVYDRTSLAPLWLYQGDLEGQRALAGGAGRIPALVPTFNAALASRLHMAEAEHGLPKGVTPEHAFSYAYALFHSPGYRERYAEFLKVDFPRLPLPASWSLFQALARFGDDLVSLHIMESPTLDRHTSRFIGSASPEVERVSYSKKTVWIDKAKTTGFQGVPEAVWDFHVGGYQVCEKWLKDRKGRILSADDIDHYHRIVVALNETIRLMSEIDDVIEQHGGWPDAFVTEPRDDGNSEAPAPFQ
jgi:predicted helicase